MATDHNFKVKNGLTVEAFTVHIDGDGTYGDSYSALGFGGTTNAYSKILAAPDSGSHLYINAGGNLYFRTNQSSDNKLVITTTGNIQMGSTTIIDSSRNLTNIGTISSGAITANGGADQTTIKSSSDAPLIVESTDAFSGILFKDTNNQGYLFYGGANNQLYTHTSRFSVAGSTLAAGYEFQVNGDANLTGSLAFGGATAIDASRNITAGTISANSGGTNVVATFTSTDGIAAIKLEDNSGNVELSASGQTFRVQPNGGDPVLVVNANGNATITSDGTGAFLTLTRDDTSTSAKFLTGSSFSYIGTTTNRPFHIYQNGASALEFNTSKNATFAGTGTFNNRVSFTDDDITSMSTGIKTLNNGGLSIELDEDNEVASTDFRIRIDRSSGDSQLVLDASGNLDIEGKTSIAASTSTSSSSALKLHVGTINNTGSSAIAQFGGFIRASDYYILHASAGSSDAIHIDYVGDDMDITSGEGNYNGGLRANAYRIGSNGTTVIDSSRNLLNIGTISSGAITATGTTTLSGLTVDGAASVKYANSSAFGNQTFTWNAQAFDAFQIYNDNSTSNTSADQFVSLHMRADGAGNASARMVLRNDNSGNGRLYFMLRGGSHTGVTQPKMLITDDGYVTISDNATTYNERLFVDGNLRVEGVYKSGTQTIIDASRNLTNIGTISSGNITSSGELTGTRVNITNATAPYIVFTEGSNVAYMGLDGGAFWIRQNGLGGGDEFTVASNGNVSIAHDLSVSGTVTTGGLNFTGDLTFSSTTATTPAIKFNNNSGTDTGFDMAIRGNAEGLDFYEPEDTDKIHMRIVDDTGVNAVFGLRTGTGNGNLRIDGSGNATLATISSSGITTSGILDFTANPAYLRNQQDNSGQIAIQVKNSGGTAREVRWDAGNNANGAWRSTTNGGADLGLTNKIWNNLFVNTIKIGTSNLEVIDSNRNITAGTISSGAITSTGNMSLSNASSGNNITINRNDTSTSAIFHIGSSRGYIGTTSNTQFEIRQNNSAAIVVDTSGDTTVKNNLEVDGSITGNLGTFYGDTIALNVFGLNNAGSTGIKFSDNGTPAAASNQHGNIRYVHADGSSYGSGNAFIVESSESTLTVLADGKLMYKEGLYLKPSSGTGAGTELIDSSRNIKNINTIASGPITLTNTAVTGAVLATNSPLKINAQEAGVHILAENSGDWASHLILTNQGNRHYWIHNAPSTASANANKFELRTSTTTTADYIGGQGAGSTAVLVVDSSGNLTAAGNYVYLVDSNNYVYVDQSTGTNMSFGLNGNTLAQIKRIGSDTGSFRPRQYSSGDTAAGYPAYAEIDDENTGLYFPAADEVGLSTGGVKRLTVASNGKVNMFGNVDIGGAVTGCTVEIAATDTSGAPASTTTLLMRGYEGRGIGTMFEDVSYSGEEWFAGMQYGGSFNRYTIGYSSSGGQAEYSSNSVAGFETDGSWYHRNTQLIDGDRKFVNLKRLNFISSTDNTEGINFGNNHRIYWNSQRVFEGNGSNLQVGEGLSGAINIQAGNGIQMNGVQVIDTNRNLFADGLYVKKITGATSGSGVANGVDISSHFTSANHNYIVELVTYGTGTDTGACYIVYYTQDTNTWSGRAVSLAGDNSNHPLLDVTSAGVITMYTNHTSVYNIQAVIHTHVGPENDSKPHVLGPYFQWQRKDDNDLYYTDGDVGIGTTDPTYKLHVIGTGKFTGDLYADGNIIMDGNSKFLVIENHAETECGIVFNDGDAGNWPAASSQAFKMQYHCGNETLIMGHDDDSYAGFDFGKGGLLTTSKLNVAGEVKFGNTTTTPAADVHFYGTGNNYLRLNGTAGNDFEVDLVGTGSTGTITFNQFNLQTNDSHTTLKRTANAALIVDRLGSTGTSGTFNGEIINLRAGGTKRGEIGYKAFAYGDSPYFATYDWGLGFFSYQQSRYIQPCDDSGAIRDNEVDLGSTSARFDDIYATNGTIQTSDRNEKQDIQELTDAETRVATACKGLIRRFRWVDSVTEKGDDARYHFGAVAQDVESAFTAEGLDAGKYGLFIRTTWWEHEGENYPSAQTAPAGAVEKTRLGIRYNQLLAFIISAL